MQSRAQQINRKLASRYPRGQALRQAQSNFFPRARLALFATHPPPPPSPTTPTLPRASIATPRPPRATQPYGRRRALPPPTMLSTHYGRPARLFSRALRSVDPTHLRPPTPLFWRAWTACTAGWPGWSASPHLPPTWTAASPPRRPRRRGHFWR